MMRCDSMRPPLGDCGVVEQVAESFLDARRHITHRGVRHLTNNSCLRCS